MSNSHKVRAHLEERWSGHPDLLDAIYDEENRWLAKRGLLGVFPRGSMYEPKKRGGRMTGGALRGLGAAQLRKESGKYTKKENWRNAKRDPETAKELYGEEARDWPPAVPYAVQDNMWINHILDERRRLREGNPIDWTVVGGGDGGEDDQPAEDTNPNLDWRKDMPTVDWFGFGKKAWETLTDLDTYRSGLARIRDAVKPADYLAELSDRPHETGPAPVIVANEEAQRLMETPEAVVHHAALLEKTPDITSHLGASATLTAITKGLPGAGVRVVKALFTPGQRVTADDIRKGLPQALDAINRFVKETEGEGRVGGAKGLAAKAMHSFVKEYEPLVRTSAAYFDNWAKSTTSKAVASAAKLVGQRLVGYNPVFGLIWDRIVPVLEHAINRRLPRATNEVMDMYNEIKRAEAARKKSDDERADRAYRHRSG